jgi:PAS domain S-box-containing protein
MTHDWHILIVDDSADDALLLEGILRQPNRKLECKRVEDAHSMRNTLLERQWDAILCDWTMPAFSALGALESLREARQDIPFIIVTGTIGEEAAVQAMRAGAHDFVLKGQLTRLGPAIEREIREAQVRKMRRRAEADLQASEARYRALFASSPLPMWVFDKQTLRFLDVNDAAIRSYGYSREDFAAMTLADIRPAEDMPAVLDDIAQGKPIDDGSVWRHRKKDGSTLYAEIRAGDFEMDGRAVRLALVTDVSKRKRAEQALRRSEERLRQAQKMEAVGRLAGGIAHDFNNLLSIIQGYSELVALGLSERDVARGHLEEVIRAARHAGDLVRHLLAFSRTQVLALQTINLNDVVDKTRRVLASLIGKDIEFVVDTSSSLHHVEADAVQLEQVLMNLVVNARDATPRNGRITVETRNVQVDAGSEQAADGVEPGRCVMLAVSDTGDGMDGETAARMFEPFFTTKEPGKGTGLGLSTVYGIVKQSQGHIRVNSKLGEGTRFEIYFPQVEHSHSRASVHPTQPCTIAGGKETILLADDDDSMRALVHMRLRQAGYEVIETKSAGDALLTCEQHTGKIDLLLTSTVLPLLSGARLAERLRPMQPSMKVLYMSATPRASLRQGESEGMDRPSIHKPFTPDLLLSSVRAVLDGVPFQA